MDIMHKVLNILLPLISISALFFFLPPFLVYKFLSSVWRSIFCENVAGKVVLITGSSSGIGEQLAYEYAKGGACLVLVARRGDRLEAVATKARELGSPDVIIETGDVSKAEDCKRFVGAAVNRFGTLDHLVNNAGIFPLFMFEDSNNVDDFAPIMNTNFWGSVYCTHFAIPHLRKSKGKIVVIASVAGWMPMPRLTIYGASKGALISFFETLRAEIGSDIGITIVTPGVVDTEKAQAEVRSKGKLGLIPAESVEGCAKATLNSICRGDRYLIEPAWVKMFYLWNLLCPEVIQEFSRKMSVTSPGTSTSGLKAE
ncbi:hydroxysteroid dehydrogenase 3 [Actinidia rufa]|uniref:Hydroxysteroid dehydrogenase 3 n=1 Tax=Actinidia rufa TaxID=165716 RepID=A0A7J0FYY6_9ERIC|nr:hydroxysteroid dehydrogenase 3 [Actinidia rufa]